MARGFKIMKKLLNRLLVVVVSALLGMGTANAVEISDLPIFSAASSTRPMTMLVMGRDHSLYYEAYSNLMDLDGDGIADQQYITDTEFKYPGYFNSDVCYLYSDADDRYVPQSVTTNKKCFGSRWSGDFLNYLTMTRMDMVRLALYGGKRSVDTDTLTILERAYIPQDSHIWGFEYEGEEVNGYRISEYTPLHKPVVVAGVQHYHLFANMTHAGGEWTEPFDGNYTYCGGAFGNPGCGQSLPDQLLATGAPNTDPKPLLKVLTNTRFTLDNWVKDTDPLGSLNCLDEASGLPEVCIDRATTIVAGPITDAGVAAGLAGITDDSDPATRSSDIESITADVASGRSRPAASLLSGRESGFFEEQGVGGDEAIILPTNEDAEAALVLEPESWNWTAIRPGALLRVTRQTYALSELGASGR